MTPHRSRSQLSLSTLRDMEYASADNVERTTLAIFFEDQLKGLIAACWFWSKALVVAQIKVPWNDASCLGLANDASPNET